MNVIIFLKITIITMLYYNSLELKYHILYSFRSKTNYTEFFFIVMITQVESNC